MCAKSLPDDRFMLLVWSSRPYLDSLLFLIPFRVIFFGDSWNCELIVFISIKKSFFVGFLTLVGL